MRYCGMLPRRGEWSGCCKELQKRRRVALVGEMYRQAIEDLLAVLMEVTDSNAGRIEAQEAGATGMTVERGTAEAGGLELPLESGAVRVGRARISGRPGGYDEALRQSVEPIRVAFGSLLQACVQRREKERLAKRLRGLAEVSDEFLCTLDRAGNVVECNAAFARALGYTQEELMKLPRLYLSGERNRERTEAGLAAVLAGRVVRGLHMALERKDGNVLWTSWNARLERNNGASIFCVGRDITDERAQLERIRTMALILERTETAVVLTDSEHRVEWANEAFERLTGFALAQLQGRRYLELDARCQELGILAQLERGEAVLGRHRESGRMGAHTGRSMR